MNKSVEWDDGYIAGSKAQNEAMQEIVVDPLLDSEKQLQTELDKVKAENKQLKHALGHTEAALDDWGDGSIGELRLRLADLQAELEAVKAERDRYKTTLSGLPSEIRRLVNPDWRFNNTKSITKILEIIKQALESDGE